MTTLPEARIQLIGFYPHLKLTEDQKQDLLTKDHLPYTINLISVEHFFFLLYSLGLHLPANRRTEI